jgi:hypothetical protein
MSTVQELEDSLKEVKRIKIIILHSAQENHYHRAKNHLVQLRLKNKSGELSDEEV